MILLSTHLFSHWSISLMFNFALFSCSVSFIFSFCQPTLYLLKICIIGKEDKIIIIIIFITLRPMPFKYDENFPQ
jgi:hypothetical protein